ncbi:Chemotaxis response regulator protein-glutamate methylesterase of group 2 operon [Sphingomonas sp. EC-HK361]|uniref:chemotaxis-specific protein-glutamate methyltransferase CheB n=1 Tax=Sphingomonas sp. EC-HK361 TaxID=2038397 RepID=UPI001251B317|nr:chemotaxis-specific protein-glutamate methyltransferase CheB [Sphingomonas sp. EC-HK361]VVT10825.1 Chemotaxis response regulator protein-glutamate methylesterase of group 2 operon [Sphingomonas sp. EC-HK361]
MSSSPQIAERSQSAAQRVLIVDDSAVARAVLTRAIGEHPNFVVAGVVNDALGALAFLENQRVDVVLLDLDMPGIDGLTALPDLIAAGCGARVLVVSSSCAEGASATVQALALGAADTLVKPGIGTHNGRFADMLAERLSRLTDPVVQGEGKAAAISGPMPETIDVVAIGASTGGIHALSQLLRAIPTDFRAPILVTQHLPHSFSPYFAAQLAVLANRPCDLAVDRLRIRPGRVIVAPGDAHMTCVALPDGTASVRLSRDPVANGCMPSVDPMMASVAMAYGARALAIMLSGMGRDGVDGARLIREAGGTVFAQDRETSVVWGMPGAVVGAGIANAVLDPPTIGRLIASRARVQP